MGQNVQAAACRQALRLTHRQLAVDDRHRRGEGVVGDGPLHARLLVGDDGERGHLTAGSAGGGDADQVGLLAHVGEGVDPLLDVHEPQRQALELHLRVLIEQPHDLGRIHRRSTAEADEDIGLERVDHSHRQRDGGERRVGLDLVEGLALDAQGGERCGDAVDHPACKEIAVRDDEGPFLALQLAQSDGQRSVFEVDLRWQLEPEHILPPCGFGLDVQEVLGPDVLTDGVVAPASTPQRQRRFEAEVVDVPDGPLARRHVHQDPAGLHQGAEGCDLLPFQLVDVEHAGVSVPSESDQGSGHGGALIKALTAVHAEHRTEFLVGERLVVLDAVDLGDEDLGGIGDGEARVLGDPGSALADDGRRHGPALGVDDDRPQQLRLLVVEEVCAAACKLRLHRIVDIIVADHRLFTGADHAVVEGLGHEDRADRHPDVGALVEEGRGIARSHADGGDAGGVGALDHRGTTGGEDQVHERVVHQEAGFIHRRLIDPGDDLLRRPCFHRCVKDHLGRRHGALLCPGVRADDDGVPRLQ